MADVLPLKIGSDGNPAEIGATDTVPLVNIRATVTPTASSIPVADGAGQLALGWMPTGVGPITVSLATSEDLAAGDLVNIYDNGGTPTVRKADADSISTRADGFVIAATTSPAAATVYMSSGLITGLSGLTGGTTYYLSTTAGGITATAPSGTADIVQRVGKATSTTVLACNIGTPFVRA